MTCKNQVVQFIPRGFGFRKVKSSCGSTGYNGYQLLCDECLAKLEKKYPQGWKDTPGDVCEHGTYIGDAYGLDYICGFCEEGV